MPLALGHGLELGAEQPSAAAPPPANPITRVAGQASGGQVTGPTVDKAYTNPVTAGNYLPVHVLSYSGGPGYPTTAPTITKVAGTATLGVQRMIGPKAHFGSPYSTGWTFLIPVTGTGTLTLRIAQAEQAFGLFAIDEIVADAGLGIRGEIIYFDGNTGAPGIVSSDTVAAKAGDYVIGFSAQYDDVDFVPVASDTVVYSTGADSTGVTGTVQGRLMAADGDVQMTVDVGNNWYFATMLLCLRNGGDLGYVAPAFTQTGVTGFPLVENPILQGGIWDRGASEGLDWSDPATDGTKAYGTEVPGSGGSGFNDSIAVLKAAPGADHYVEYTIADAGVAGPGHEVEGLCRFSIAANVATGYECDPSVSSNSGSDHWAIARWEGPIGGFTPLIDLVHGGSLPAGTVVRFGTIGDRFYVYRDGVLVFSFRDATWAGGSAGFGMFTEEVGGANNNQFGISQFKYGTVALAAA